MDRKQFTTTIDNSIQLHFKKKCLKEGQKMNEVLEVLMQYYNNGNFSIKREISFNSEK
ncbi:MAG: hypothetical protein ACRCWM_03875 [Sarcina sp.]